MGLSREGLWWGFSMLFSRLVTLPSRNDAQALVPWCACLPGRGRRGAKNSGPEIASGKSAVCLRLRTPNRSDCYTLATTEYVSPAAEGEPSFDLAGISFPLPAPQVSAPLCPLSVVYRRADMLNHRPGCASYIDWCADTQSVVLRPDVSVRPGEQLFGSYGERSSGELLLSYGFVPAVSSPSGSGRATATANSSDDDDEELAMAWRGKGGKKGGKAAAPKGAAAAAARAAAAAANPHEAAPLVLGVDPRDPWAEAKAEALSARGAPMRTRAHPRAPARSHSPVLIHSQIQLHPPFPNLRWLSFSGFCLVGLDIQRTFWIREEAFPGNILPYAEFVRAFGSGSGQGEGSVEGVRREADKARADTDGQTRRHAPLQHMCCAGFFLRDFSLRCSRLHLRLDLLADIFPSFICVCSPLLSSPHSSAQLFGPVQTNGFLGALGWPKSAPAAPAGPTIAGARTRARTHPRMGTRRARALSISPLNTNWGASIRTCMLFT